MASAAAMLDASSGSRGVLMFARMNQDGGEASLSLSSCCALLDRASAVEGVSGTATTPSPCRAFTRRKKSLLAAYARSSGRIHVHVTCDSSDSI
eukprot:7380106-Prymnesium_polylepis.1